MAIDRFELAVATLLSLEQIQREASQAFEFVARGASVDDITLLLRRRKRKRVVVAPLAAPTSAEAPELVGAESI